MSFLTIPSQDGLFKTIRNSGEEADDDEDEEDDPENVHLIPRCSPVPRKRGASIFDETAEYMRIHQALSAGRKRVSFADTTGGDLVDVKEFVAFESDDEEAEAHWEAEEAKYRRPQREPVYDARPEFQARSGDALLEAVRANKVEMEDVSPVPDEPLSFCGTVRVLNVSFHKAVYIRTTMDSWATHFDHLAEYVQGSNDGETDRFSFKLSFAPPYVTHGSRIEFVIRYETSEGDFWANNSSMNYAVTLLLSYPDDSAQTQIDIKHLRGILRPPKDYSMDNTNFDSDEEQGTKEAEVKVSSEVDRPAAPIPALIQPVIDIEIAVRPSGPSVPPDQGLPSVDGALTVRNAPCLSSEATPPASPPSATAGEPETPLPLPELLRRHSDDRTTEWRAGGEGVGSSPSAPPQQELKNCCEDGGEAATPTPSAPSEATRPNVLSAEMNPLPSDATPSDKEPQQSSARSAPAPAAYPNPLAPPPGSPPTSASPQQELKQCCEDGGEATAPAPTEAHFEAPRPTVPSAEMTAPPSDAPCDMEPQQTPVRSAAYRNPSAPPPGPPLTSASPQQELKNSWEGAGEAATPAPTEAHFEAPRPIVPSTEKTPPPSDATPCDMEPQQTPVRSAAYRNSSASPPGPPPTSASPQQELKNSCEGAGEAATPTPSEAPFEAPRPTVPSAEKTPPPSGATVAYPNLSAPPPDPPPTSASPQQELKNCCKGAGEAAAAPFTPSQVPPKAPSKAPHPTVPSAKMTPPSCDMEPQQTPARSAAATPNPSAAPPGEEEQEAFRIPRSAPTDRAPSLRRELIPYIAAACGVVSLSIVMQEPTALLLIGLLFVVKRLRSRHGSV